MLQVYARHKIPPKSGGRTKRESMAGKLATARCVPASPAGGRSAMRNRDRVPLQEQWNGLMPHPLGRKSWIGY